MADLDILPKKIRKIETGEKKPRYFIILILIVILTVYGGLFFYNQSLERKMKNLETEIYNIITKRDKNLENRIIEIKNKLNNSDILLKNHIFWTKGLNEFQKLVLPEIQLKNLNANAEQGKIEIRASAPNLTTIAKQGANFLSSRLIKDIEINQIKNLPTGQTEFFVNIIFDRINFLK